MIARRCGAAAVALVLVASAAACAHSLSVAPPKAPRAAAAPRSCAIRAEVLQPPSTTGVDPGAVLDARLRARGATELLHGDGEAAGGARIELYLVGDRATPLTRWTVLPWGIVFLGTLGLVPHREAREHVVEVHAVLPEAPAARRVRVARRSYVAVTWSWLPLALRGRDARARGAAHRAHEEGLAGAVDAALDEVLGGEPEAAAPPPPGR